MKKTHTASLLLAQLAPSTPEPICLPFQSPALFTPQLLSRLHLSQPHLLSPSIPRTPAGSSASSLLSGGLRIQLPQQQGSEKMGSRGQKHPSGSGNNHLTLLCLLLLTPAPCTYYAPATQVFSMVLKHTELIPASCPWHLLFSLPGMKNSDFHRLGSSSLSSCLRCHLLKTPFPGPPPVILCNVILYFL